MKGITVRRNPEILGSVTPTPEFAEQRGCDILSVITKLVGSERAIGIADRLRIFERLGVSSESFTRDNLDRDSGLTQYESEFGRNETLPPSEQKLAA